MVYGPPNSLTKSYSVSLISLVGENFSVIEVTFSLRGAGVILRQVGKRGDGESFSFSLLLTEWQAGSWVLWSFWAVRGSHSMGASETGPPQGS